MKDLLELAEELFLRPMPGKIGEMKQRRARTNGVEGEEKALNDDYEKKRKGKEEEEKFECRLVKYEALPDYLKDNEFILDYYRSEWPLKETFLSVFLWHNETLNIWTHLGGFFLFLGLTIMNLMEINVVGQHISTSSGAVAESLMKNISHSFFSEHQASHILEDQALTLTSKPVTFTRVPRWPWFVFLGGAMVCLSFSSITHLLHSHSRRANFFFWALDYTGISTMILSSFFPAIYYAFFCHPTLQLFYLSTISLIGLITVVTLTSPSLSSPRFRPLRGGLFLGMGFWGLIPAVHAIIINWGHSDSLMGHAYETVMALAYATGAGIYMSRIPERWRPGAFDIAGHSHQIFHVFVIVGALAHYTAMRVLMDWRDGGATCLLQ
ncbi:hypothetical protein MRB53_022308 [Persea americana]|uniref:Uncharacterized protein n=1 Tax=Persea americana TaxID=3435 RepID=A0ACC2L6W8_PERAE|nr:hypothetical protein MRB53_022308 [Persea americana]